MNRLHGTDASSPGAVLRDGSTIQVRPIRSQDKALLTDAFAQLGPDSRYQRFLAPIKRLSPQELGYLTEIDHHDHEALVALDPASGNAIGVARFVRSSPASDTAEVAIAVVDAWQQRGVGTVLLHELACRAREEGIGHFSALALADNWRVLEVLGELGATHRGHPESGVIELLIDLPATPAEAQRVLRTAAPAAADGWQDAPNAATANP